MLAQSGARDALLIGHRNEYAQAREIEVQNAVLMSVRRGYQVTHTTRILPPSSTNY